MIWESISSCIATYGWLSALVVTFLVIVATQFYYFYKSEERDILENVRPAQENMSVGEMLTSEGYTEERLRDVADYAWMLQNYDSNGIGDQEANDVKLLDDENSKAVVQDRWDLKLLKDLRTTLTTPLDRNDVQDTDSMLVNTPEDEDQEMDILDLTPDDISINCDEDADEEDAAISPQAMADIEAEMLDSSILSENLDEQDNLEIEDRDDTDVNMETVTSLIENTLSMALGEIGMECVIRGNEDISAEQAVFNESKKYARILERIISEGTREKACKDNTNLTEDSGDAICLVNKTDEEFDEPPLSSKIEEIKVCAGEGSCANDNTDPSNYLHIKDEGRTADEEMNLSVMASNEIRAESEVLNKSNEPATSEIQQKDVRVCLSSSLCVTSNKMTVDSIEARENKVSKAIENSSVAVGEEKQTEWNLPCESACTNKASIYEWEDLFTFSCDLVSDYLSTRAWIEAYSDVEREQMISSIDKPKATSTAPSELQSSPTAEEMEEEKRTQQYQLAQILELMQQNPNMFGKITQSDMDDQARLYNM